MSLYFRGYSTFFLQISTFQERPDPSKPFHGDYSTLIDSDIIIFAKKIQAGHPLPPPDISLTIKSASIMKLLTTLSLAAAIAFPMLSETFTPRPAPNPWADDYRSLYEMRNWRSWGTYNVHDPSCRKVGDYFYMYSTDAIYRENRRAAKPDSVPIGFIQMRRSRDLVNWEFLGWAFPEIPREAVDWVKEKADGKGATNIWAPYMTDCGGNLFRLYYCVSAFGKNTSYIGLAEAGSPEGPWIQKGAVVRTDTDSPMNAIDPSVITDGNGRQWMHYGSYFGGLYCVELDPATGLAMTPGDQGHLVARRANWRKDNLEAPEIIRHDQNGKYYLFQSYDPLMTTYNVRVARADRAEGPFFDFHGKEISDTTNNFPILTAPYSFGSHPGWMGTAHCGVFSDGNGNYFMAHQGRYVPDTGLMVLHIRQVFMTPGGWPVVSPERYAGVPAMEFTTEDIAGEWEVIRVTEPRVERDLEAGQILRGEGDLRDGEGNKSFRMTIEPGGKVSGNGEWIFDKTGQTLSLTIDGEGISGLMIHSGHDWERETDTILFTGLDSNGRSVWGKRIK